MWSDSERHVLLKKKMTWFQSQSQAVGHEEQWGHDQGSSVPYFVCNQVEIALFCWKRKNYLISEWNWLFQVVGTWRGVGIWPRLLLCPTRLRLSLFGWGKKWLGLRVKLIVSGSGYMKSSGDMSKASFVPYLLFNQVECLCSVEKKKNDLVSEWNWLCQALGTWRAVGTWPRLPLCPISFATRSRLPLFCWKRNNDLVS